MLFVFVNFIVLKHVLIFDCGELHRLPLVCRLIGCLGGLLVGWFAGIGMFDDLASWIVRGFALLWVTGWISGLMLAILIWGLGLVVCCTFFVFVFVILVREGRCLDFFVCFIVCCLVCWFWLVCVFYSVVILVVVFAGLIGLCVFWITITGTTCWFVLY